MKTNKRNGTIELLRFLFCLLIVVYHSRNLGKTSSIALFTEAGYIAVEFFFLVSGFLMAKTAAGLADVPCTHLGRETVLFVWKKIKAILPYYLFAVVFAFGYIVAANSLTLKESVLKFAQGIWDIGFLHTSGIKTYEVVRGSWYLSAMFVAMLALYPMLRKWKDTFTHIIAPLLAITLLGWISQTYGNLNQWIKNFDLVCAGVLRAVAELSLGCIGYVVCEKIKDAPFTVFSRILITLTQVAGYGIVFWCAGNMSEGWVSYVLLLCLAVCVPLSFSGQGIAAPLFRGRFFLWLGKLSLVIYLNHMWVKDCIAKWLPESLGYWNLLGICLLSSLTVSLLCMLLIKLLQLFWKKCGKHVRRLFLKKTEV